MLLRFVKFDQSDICSYGFRMENVQYILKLKNGLILSQFQPWCSCEQNSYEKVWLNDEIILFMMLFFLQLFLSTSITFMAGGAGYN